MTTASFETFARELKREGVKKVKGRVARRRVLVRQAQDRAVPGRTGCSSSAGRCPRSPATRGSTNGNRVERAGHLRGQADDQGARATPASRSRASRARARCPDTARLVDQQYSARAPRHPQAHEQGERQLLRRDAAQGTRQGLLRRGQHRGRHQGEQGRPPRAGRQDRHLRHPGRLRAELRQPAHRRGRGQGARRDAPAARTSTTTTTRWRSPARTARWTTACAARRPPATPTPRRARSTSPSASPATSTSANDHLVAFSILMNGGSLGTSGWGTATTAQDKIVVALAKASLPGEPCWRRRRCSASTPSQPSRRFTALAASSSPASSHSSTASAAAAVSASTSARLSRNGLSTYSATTSGSVLGGRSTPTRRRA